MTIPSWLKHVLGTIATAMGVITASVPALHLPVAVSSLLVAVEPGLLWIEHHATLANQPVKPAVHVQTASATIHANPQSPVTTVPTPPQPPIGVTNA